MSMKDYEDLAAKYLSDSNSPDVKKTMNQISGALKTSEGQKIAETLTRNYSDTMKQAAAAASAGDLNSAKRAINEILSTKEGAEMASKLLAMFGKK